ncbi:MAG: site-2 protease family protein [Achromobacter sp.]|uniref:site-2 protease family protein n=1 Tax=Achromobacter sp. TaxID=134375 RepID=UPI003D069345
MTVAFGAIGLLLAVALCALVHVTVMAFAGRALGVALDELSFGLGPRLLRLGRVSIRLLPVGGAVRFQTAGATMPADGTMPADVSTPTAATMPADEADVDPRHLEAQPLWAQLFIGASGCFALIALACALLGGMAGVHALADGFANIVSGALSPLHTAQALLARVDAAAHGLPFPMLLGLTAATTAALNLLPLPGANGGYLLGALGKSAGLGKHWPASLTQILLLAYVALAASWLVAAVVYLSNGV